MRGSGKMQASVAPESEGAAHACPACGKAVDSLRAGHVAILGERFVYFCDQRCKKELIAQSSGLRPSEVATAEPPPVSSMPVSEERSAGPSATGGAREVVARALAAAAPAPAAREAPDDEPPT